ncbi:MAG: TIGR01458 family HAD-type hydrolase [Candidatus Zixiibacteriota bacterium]
MKTDFLKSARGFLFDLDGVFFVGSTPIPGGAEAIRFLKERNIPCRFTTNTTTRSQATLYAEIRAMRMPIEASEIFSAPQAAVRFLRTKGSCSCHFLLNDDTRRDFAEFTVNDRNPDYVVIGDIGERWNYPLLNSVFQMLMSGAEMLALHKGRYWQMPDGLKMDIGAFIAGLEFVSGKTAAVVGKPSKEFFHYALADMGVSPSEAVMIGDDLISDVGGAQNAGVKGVLVRTGKFREELVARSAIQPDLIIDSIADLPKYLQFI